MLGGSFWKTLMSNAAERRMIEYTGQVLDAWTALESVFIDCILELEQNGTQCTHRQVTLVSKGSRLRYTTSMAGGYECAVHSDRDSLKAYITVKRLFTDAF